MKGQAKIRKWNKIIDLSELLKDYVNKRDLEMIKITLENILSLINYQVSFDKLTIRKGFRHPNKYYKRDKKVK